MQNILIFGATGAMGKAIAKQLSKEGAALCLAGRDQSELDQLAQECGQSRTCTFDAFDDASLANAVAYAEQSGPITGLIWAVGSILLKPLSKLSSDDFSQTFHLNVTAAALAIKQASASLKEGEGSVLLFSSVAASQGFSAHGAIGAAKAGVEGLALALATELAPDIRVNVIAPSLTYSKMAQPLLNNEVMAKGIAQAHPVRRLGQGQDFAHLASLLMDGTKSGWITGAVIPVDGGRKSLRTKG